MSHIQQLIATNILHAGTNIATNTLVLDTHNLPLDYTSATSTNFLCIRYALATMCRWHCVVDVVITCFPPPGCPRFDRFDFYKGDCNEVSIRSIYNYKLHLDAEYSWDIEDYTEYIGYLPCTIYLTWAQGPGPIWPGPIWGLGPYGPMGPCKV